MPRPFPVYRVGDLEVTVISDGTFWLDAGSVFGPVPRTVWEPVVGDALNALNQIPLSLNCLVVRGSAAARVVLIETGMGNKLDERGRRFYPGDYGYLVRELAELGIFPDEVDIVINTHLHQDHCGWNTTRLHGALVPTFPNARYYVQRKELDLIEHPNERTRATYVADNIQPLMETKQVTFLDDEFQVTPEVRIVPTPGHTPGHASVVLASGHETGVYIGDIGQHRAQVERLAWMSGFDLMPLVSLETRRRLLREAVARNELLFCAHNPYPGVGRLREDESGQRTLVDEPPAETLP